MALELGAATYTYLFTTDLADALGRLADLGFRSCELMVTPPHLWPPDVGERERDDLRRRLREHGLRLTAINPTYLDLNLSSTNPQIRAEAVRQVRECVDLAADLGARFLLVGTGRRHPLIPAPWDWLYPKTLDALAEIVAHAEARGVTIAVENIPTLFLERAEHLVRVCEDLQSDAVTAVFDVANAYLVEDVVAGLEVVAPHLSYVHLSDTRRSPWGHLRVGAGDIDFGAIAETLDRLGFTGPSTLEVIDPDDPDGALRESVRQLEELGWKR